MYNKNLYLYANPEFDKRFNKGISKLYRLFCLESGFNLCIVDDDFLQSNIPLEKFSQTLVIAGGDGTLHKALNLIPDEALDKYVFGIIPGGTANEFAKSLSLPKSIINAAKIIVNPKVLSYCSIGIINNKHRFLTGILYGVADYVLKITPQFAKNYLGPSAFHYGVVRLFYKMIKENKKKYKSFIIDDQKINTNYLLINNLSLVTKNFKKEDIPFEDRKLFSLIYLQPGLSSFNLMNLLYTSLFSNKILKDKRIHYSQLKSIAIDPMSTLECLIDGERYSFNSALEVKHATKPIAVISA